MRSQLEVKIAAGVKDVHITDCIFIEYGPWSACKDQTRQRQLSVLDDISFENIDMDNVMTPFVVNSFYFCDPDGKTEICRYEKTAAGGQKNAVY